MVNSRSIYGHYKLPRFLLESLTSWYLSRFIFILAYYTICFFCCSTNHKCECHFFLCITTGLQACCNFLVASIMLHDPNLVGFDGSCFNTSWYVSSLVLMTEIYDCSALLCINCLEFWFVVHLGLFVVHCFARYNESLFSKVARYHKPLHCLIILDAKTCGKLLNDFGLLCRPWMHMVMVVAQGMLPSDQTWIWSIMHTWKAQGPRRKSQRLN